MMNKSPSVDFKATEGSQTGSSYRKLAGGGNKQIQENAMLI